MIQNRTIYNSIIKNNFILNSVKLKYNIKHKDCRWNSTLKKNY